jgi:hypothetical protein
MKREEILNDPSFQGSQSNDLVGSRNLPIRSNGRNGLQIGAIGRIAIRCVAGSPARKLFHADGCSGFPNGSAVLATRYRPGLFQAREVFRRAFGWIEERSRPML